MCRSDAVLAGKSIIVQYPETMASCGWPGRVMVRLLSNYVFAPSASPASSLKLGVVPSSAQGLQLVSVVS
jgi:hypothetical protein